MIVFISYSCQHTKTSSKSQKWAHSKKNVLWRGCLQDTHTKDQVCKWKKGTLFKSHEVSHGQNFKHEPMTVFITNRNHWAPLRENHGLSV